ncbi:apoptosis facilitator Bcl-2-like protein 14 [Xiphias gladius]|uniref:apoptosis facilitator Bcl-2-like protein 14 n=1 Tax=Xiphias gladius TaxID=8245 RepID=UPI001A9900A2|nr:apoptosis facilitator Bcl-2-like protein 14 [Xiphias gladius]XP_039989100.1 apoptosis facilitator Bcl-2-like protein 14 [Xiphias gladius]
MIRLGDDIHEKIKENTVLQQQLSNLNYNMFEKLTSGVQNLVGQRGQATASEERIQRQKIAWAFEVTSRLSATGVVQRRRVLSFGELYIQQHHSAWVQQHGGWEEVFAVD